jgi:hypothetical protein
LFAGGLYFKAFGRFSRALCEITFLLLCVILSSPIAVAARSKGMGLGSLTCRDWGFESRRVHRCPSSVSVECSQVDVSGSGWSLVQRSPTDYLSVR